MLGDLLQTVMRRQDLTADQATAAMDAIIDGRARGAQVAGLLVGLAMKGERPDEIVGFARSMRARAVRINAPEGGTVDLCGTGGDGAGTFNISSVAAVVVAACGVTVAKHGNRSVSSRCGSADLFEALGVNVAAPPPVVEACLAETGMAFLFAPVFHPSMRNVAEVRRELGVRTAFNLLGPLTNPTHPRRQLIGVPRPECTELIARSLSLLGSERAWVVHGADGLDEISTTGYTKVSEARGGTVNTFYLHPGDAGLPKATLASLAGGDAATNAEMAREILRGSTGPARDIVLLNAGAVLLLAGKADTLRDGIARAGQAIDSGAAQATLDRLVARSNDLSGASSRAGA
ncbi:MAG: anthranilate phosphoribosyltransferase [Acidobacteria bacterium]|nr:anthranilate phosphoribosyltransferase [Acidobacteriota bacterium]